MERERDGSACLPLETVVYNKITKPNQTEGTHLEVARQLETPRCPQREIHRHNYVIQRGPLVYQHRPEERPLPLPRGAPWSAEP